MTVTNAVPEVWAAALETALTSQTLMSRLMQDRSSELSSFGDKLNINQITSSVTLQDYVQGTALPAAQRPTTSNTPLTINKNKAFNIAVEDIDEMQTRASIMQDWARLATEKFATTFDADLYAVLDSSWDTSGDDQNAFAATLKPSAVKDKAKRTVLINEVREFQLRANRANWSEAGRNVTFSPEAFDLVTEYFAIDAPDTGAGQIVDQAIAEGTRPRLFGFNVHVYNGIPATEAQHVPMAIFSTNRWGAYAVQVSKVEAYRPELAFQDALKGLLTYGAIELHKESKMALRQPA